MKRAFWVPVTRSKGGNNVCAFMEDNIIEEKEDNM